MSKKVAVLGLGIMGSGMARRLVGHAHDVTVWNRNIAKTIDLEEAGARVAATPADAVKGADVVIAMLANDDASRDVWLGEHGALAAMLPGAIAIESSTLTIEWIKDLATAARARGVSFLDAPVTGSKVQASTGALTFLVGGNADIVERARPVLSAMGSHIAHLGPSGSGTILKLVNNFLCGVQAATLAEAVGMIERSGLDARQAVAILAGGAPGSPLIKTLSQRMLDRAYEPNFFVPLMAKDLDYARAAFESAGIELATADAARERFVAADRAGLGDQDIAAIVELLRR